ncbi:hypothetical protein P691DRAFT_786315 [Macrolepiota fuliginosa MF-IS2]|uniref:DUF6533 domain-containing protein n=1 Tax=Macrolepiota fuliginosa MF-IS2 TaxID=1400762 RepID=A0A9P5X7E0_9AGAR|nr:hypothetical protein P691DRAFT_786315 [Macrolepiota fuliginosa MF-IS2]
MKLTLVRSALLYYDYCLTFTSEVELIWGQRFRLSTLLYFFCRYALISNVVYTLTLAGVVHGRCVLHDLWKVEVAYTNDDHQSCDLGYRISATTSILGRLAVLTPVEVVWGIRTYSVCGNSRIIAVWLFVLGLGCIVANIHTTLTKLRGILAAGLLFGILLGLFELSAAILTTTRSIQALRAGGGWRAQNKGFVVCIFTAIPYLVNFILHTPVRLIASVRFEYFSFPHAIFQAIQRLLNAYPMPITGLMTARFLLYLRKWEKCRCISQEGSITEQMSMQFRPRGSAGTSSFADEFGRDPMSSTTGNGARADTHQAAV